MADPGAVTEPAPAKLNLFLRVLGGRDDGYHEIRSLLLPITLADGVQVRARGDLSLTVIGECAADVPRGGDNLVLRAARALGAEARLDPGAEILLSKRIPVAAGLGGGSADAAATLRALDELWGIGLGIGPLREVAARVGSDIPGMIEIRPALVGGRGEVVDAIEMPRTWWVLLTQPFGVRAGDAYRWWDEDGASQGPDPEPVLEALGAGDLGRAGDVLHNDLEGPVAARHPEVEAARKRLLDAGALGTIMVGSGPTVAGLVRDGFEAEGVATATGGIATTVITPAGA